MGLVVLRAGCHPGRGHHKSAFLPGGCGEGRDRRVLEVLRKRHGTQLGKREIPVRYMENKNSGEVVKSVSL